MKIPLLKTTILLRPIIKSRIEIGSITYNNKIFVCRRIYTTKKGETKFTFRCGQDSHCNTSLTRSEDGSIQECKNFLHTCSNKITREYSSNMNDHDYDQTLELIRESEENCLMLVYSNIISQYFYF